MTKSFARLLTGVALTSALVCAQSFQAGQPQQPASQPAPATTPDSAVMPDLSGLQDMLRSAETFHSAVRDMHLENKFQESQAASAAQNNAAADPNSPAARKKASTQRTMAMVGAGAGIGVALASMTGDKKAVMYGAIAGGVGGLIIDQIMRQRANKVDANRFDDAAQYDAVPATPGKLKTRSAPAE